MVNDFEKAALLVKLEKAFNVDEELLKILLSQIKSTEIKENFSRIKRGLNIEAEYQDLFETLPWIKNLHGLEQKQNPIHKEDYQVPDFSLLIENNAKENFPILVEVKSVRKHKENFEMIPKQKHSLLSYARDNNQVILLAIYWEKYAYWTHTVLTALEGKKKNKMTFEHALKNDISHILSDYFFLCTKKFYRKTKFSNESQNDIKTIMHGKYGAISDVEISKDGKEYIKIDALYSVVIDSALPMKEVSFDVQTNTLTEIFESRVFMKLSTWILRYLNIWGIDGSETFGLKDEKGNIMNNFVMARYAIIDFMHQIGIASSYLIPEFKDKHTEEIFSLAYKDSSVMRNYLREKP